METPSQDATPNWAYWMFGLIIAAVITLAAIGSRSTPQANQSTAPPVKAAEETKATTPPPVPPKPSSPWDYHESKDAMGLGSVFTARVESTNTVEFKFPYQGEQRGRLTLRSHPQHGKDVIFTISRGQFLIDPTEGCSILLRFDTEKPIRLRATGASDHSTTMLFLSGYQTMVARLKKAKAVKIQAPVYQEGLPVFEFNIEGLEWPPSTKTR